MECTRASKDPLPISGLVRYVGKPKEAHWKLVPMELGQETPFDTKERVLSNPMESLTDLRFHGKRKICPERLFSRRPEGWKRKAAANHATGPTPWVDLCTRIGIEGNAYPFQRLK